MICVVKGLVWVVAYRYTLEHIQVIALLMCPSKGDKYVINELQHTDHLFLGVACFTFLEFCLKNMWNCSLIQSLSNWVRTIRSLVQGQIHKLKNCVNSRPKSVFKDQEAVKCLSSLHDKCYRSCRQGFPQHRVCM
jgi:hypothetical protein